MTDMDRLERFIVDVVSADYENYGTISKEVFDWATEESINCSDTLVSDALESAVSHGYVTPFKYSRARESFEPTSLTAPPYDALYFRATTKGRNSLP
jgi:hypothetical protein